MGIIALTSAVGVGNALIPPEGPAAIPLGLDFTASGSPPYTIDVGQLMQRGQGFPGLSVLQTLYADLSEATEPLVVQVQATGQNLTIPPQSQGYYPIISPAHGVIQFTCADQQAFVSVYLLNVPVPPNSWSISGAGGSGGIADAPKDGSSYLRKNGAWVEYVAPEAGGGGGIADAPDDGRLYVRASQAWTLAPIQADAAANGNYYARLNNAWAVAPAGGGGGDGGGGGGGAGHEYWRIRMTANNNNGQWLITELQFREVANGASVAIGGTPFASSSNNPATQGAGEAFDGDANTFWYANTSNAGEFIGYQFANAVDIVEVSITPDGGAPYNYYAPGPFDLEYSDDGQNYTLAKSFVPAAWQPGAAQTFDV